MDPLQRTESRESQKSVQSRQTSHSLSSASSGTSTSRKARSAADTTSSNAERNGVSMPPPASKTISRQYPPRRLSKASDSVLLTSAPSAPSASSALPEASKRSAAAGLDQGDADITPTLEGNTPQNPPAAEATLPLRLPHAALTTAKPMADSDLESNRLSFSSLYSLGSGIYNSVVGIAGSSTPSNADSEAEGRPETTALHPTTALTTSGHSGPLSVSPQTLLARENASAFPTSLPSSAISINPALSTSPNSQALNWATAVRQDRPQAITRSRSRTRTQRRISGTNFSSSASPGSERSDYKDKNDKQKAPLGVIGVCALDTKARSKPSRNILSKLMSKHEFEVNVFGDKVILDEDVENWPVCDYLISFFSDGFPLEKAIAYSKLRKPFSVNDLPMQSVLWDRRLCLMILDKIKVPTPERLEVNRDGGPILSSPDLAHILFERTGVKLPGPDDGTGGGMKPPNSIELIEDGDALCIDGKVLRKPFVEKPVSGEDHNIRIYMSKADGGGGRRLFRKVNNKSSEADDSIDVPRCITEKESSYIYEKFLRVENSEDVKAYTIGPNFCHAETRKSPVVDGIVKRNPNGKELRYVANLSKEEAEMAARIVKAFGQTVCGFDLLRAGGKSFVIDVNGWSFVKDNNEYYDAAARILKDMFTREKARREGKSLDTIEWDQSDQQVTGPALAQPPRRATGGHRSTLKGLFHSPSMSKLTGAIHHAHLPHRHGANSPDITASTIAMSSPPSLERPSASLGISLPASQPNMPLPAMSDTSRSEAKSTSTLSAGELSPVPPPASKAQWKLKGVVSVVRHADRTPKQKFKFTFHTKPFVDLLKGHQEEVLLIGEAALNSVLEAVQVAFEEGVEDRDKLKLLRTSLVKKGAWAGTKVQIKPMFRKRKNEERVERERRPSAQEAHLASIGTPPAGECKEALEHLDSQQSSATSVPDVTLSRFSAKEQDLVLDKLQLIIKWGGEPTHSARYQSQDLGENLRSDLMIMNRECLEDVRVYSSSERRVTTSAQIFAASFLAQKDLPENFVKVRKSLLDDSNAAKDEMDKVKKKLKQLMREGDAAPPQFAWPENTPEPFIVVQKVVELMKFHRDVMHYNFSKLQTGAVTSLSAIINPKTSSDESSTVSNASSSYVKEAQEVSKIQPRWCSGEDAELFRERWEKLFKEFCDETKVDPSKISELYDTMKFDALHNRQFLEWVFTPEAHLLDEENAISESGATSPTLEPTSRPSGTSSSSRRTSTTEAHRPSITPSERAEKDRTGHLAQRFANLRRRPSGEERVPNNATSKAYRQANESTSQESYFTLYTGVSSGQSKAKVDARLHKLRELYKFCKVLFDYIGPQEYGISPEEKLEIGLLTSLPLLREIVQDLEEMQASDEAKSFFYFTKESHIYTLLNCILEGGVKTKIERKAIPELDYLSQIMFELYESQNVTREDEPQSFNYSIRITISPGCHTFDPLDVQLDSKHCIGCAPRRSLTAHGDWKEILDTLKAKFAKVKLPKSFTAVNLSEKGVFRDRATEDAQSMSD